MVVVMVTGIPMVLKGRDRSSQIAGSAWDFIDYAPNLIDDWNAYELDPQVAKPQWDPLDFDPHGQVELLLSTWTLLQSSMRKPCKQRKDSVVA